MTTETIAWQADRDYPRMIAETDRYYYDRTDVAFSQLVPTDTQTACPYSGVTSGYWSVRTGHRARRPPGSRVGLRLPRPVS